MLYSVYCLDVENSEAQRNELREIHRAYLDEWKDKLFFSGPLLDDEDESVQLGSLFILKVKDRAEALSFIENEVFYTHGVFGEIKVVRMRKGRYNPDIDITA